MNCPTCNTINDNQSRFCEQCGRPLESDPATGGPKTRKPYFYALLLIPVLLLAAGLRPRTHHPDRSRMLQPLRQCRLGHAHLLAQRRCADRRRTDHPLHHLRFEPFRVAHRSAAFTPSSWISRRSGRGDNYADTEGDPPRASGRRPARRLEALRGGIQQLRGGQPRNAGAARHGLRWHLRGRRGRGCAQRALLVAYPRSRRNGAYLFSSRRATQWRCKGTRRWSSGASSKTSPGWCVRGGSL